VRRGGPKKKEDCGKKKEGGQKAKLNEGGRVQPNRQRGEERREEMTDRETEHWKTKTARLGGEEDALKRGEGKRSS